MPGSRDNIDEKIFQTIEKLGQIWRAHLWKAVLSEELSPIQGQILIFIARHHKRRNRVGEMALEFGLSPATISDAVKALIRKELIYKFPNEHDKRIHHLGLTPAGKQVDGRLTGWANAIKTEIKKENSVNKRQALSFLLGLIARLKRKRLVDMVRLCLFCQHFHPHFNPGSKRPHYCDLLARPLDIVDIRLDCPTFLSTRGES